jgi:peptide deformylase
MLTILQTPNPILSRESIPVEKIDSKTRGFIRQMTFALDNSHDPEGVGLAAIQVGKPLQIFIVRQTPRSPLLVFINPKIVEFLKDAVQKEKDHEKNIQLEGCLSLQDIWGVVKRHDAVVLSYQDETGKQHSKKFDGFLAVIIQHEVDHLAGKLFPARVLEQKNQLYKSQKDKKGRQIFEEIKL